MSALIIKALGSITDPLPNTPKLPDIESGLYWDLDAATITGLNDGDLVTSWVGTGPSPANNRTADHQQTGWGLPTFSSAGGAGGAPALAFNGEQQLRISSFASTPFSGPYTVAVVCSGGSSATDGVNRARFYGGTGPNPAAITPTGNGQLNVGLSSGGAVGVPLPSGHFVVVISYNGANSAWGVSGLRAAPLSIPAIDWDGAGFGGTTLTGTPNGGLHGTITRALLYRRAFNTYDIDALVASLRAQYGI